MTEQTMRGVSYDVFVDWNARLKRELPFFRTLFAEHDVTRVLDAGCGTGQHAIALAREGYDVAGFDPSDEMRDQAMANAAEAGVNVPILPGTFDQAPCIVANAFNGPADAVLSLGNGLPHVDGVDGLREALAAFAESLRPGGVLVLHLLNHAMLLRKRVRAMLPKVRETAEGTIVFLRVLDYVDGGIVFDFITLARDPGALIGDERHALDVRDEWQLDARRSLHTALPVDLLAEELDAAGFDVAATYGSHEPRALDVANDESVIVVATKR